MLSEGQLRHTLAHELKDKIRGDAQLNAMLVAKYQVPTPKVYLVIRSEREGWFRGKAVCLNPPDDDTALDTIDTVQIPTDASFPNMLLRMHNEELEASYRTIKGDICEQNLRRELKEVLHVRLEAMGLKFSQGEMDKIQSNAIQAWHKTFPSATEFWVACGTSTEAIEAKLKEAVALTEKLYQRCERVRRDCSGELSSMLKEIQNLSHPNIVCCKGAYPLLFL